MDGALCTKILSTEAEKTSHRGSVNRNFTLQGRRSSLSSLSSSISVENNNEPVKRRRNSAFESSSKSSLFSSSSGFMSNNCDSEDLDVNSSADTLIPTVVLTPGSPTKDFVFQTEPLVKTLFQPKSKDGMLILGRTSNLTATCLDIESEDVLNNNTAKRGPISDDDESTCESITGSDVSVCSLNTTTMSQGELCVLQPKARGGGANVVEKAAFKTVRNNTVSVSSDSVTKTTTTTTASRVIYNKNDRKSSRTRSSNSFHSHLASNLCPENPFKKVFAKRKEFYQNIANKEPNVSSVNRLLLKKRHCALCCSERRSCQEESSPKVEEEEKVEPKKENSSSRITLSASIEPFAPFTISHDINANNMAELTVTDEDGKLTTKSSSSDLLKVMGEGGLALSADGQELRYAASTINSEDGVESHLEVSLTKDGSSIITTRTKRLGSPSEISNNSILKVQYDDTGGKVVDIRHTQQKVRRHPTTPSSGPNSFLLNLLSKPASREFKSSSAYCTAVANTPLVGGSANYVINPRYNSLPNISGGFGPAGIASGMFALSSDPDIFYNSHPADEEKRVAFTRGEPVFVV